MNRPALVLATGVLAFAIMSFALSTLRVLELQPTAYDLGIYQQALWTGGHGGSYYEAPDWQSAGYGTIFEVHLAPILVALAPLYAAFPTPLTLLIVQSTVVAFAALPLYFLARDARNSSTDGLAAAGLYLLWAPLLAGVLFDFHLEAFGPLELFGLLWAWRTRRYLLSALLVLIIALSGEFALPTLVAVGVYEAVRTRTTTREGRERGFRCIRDWLRRPETWSSLALAAAGLLSWVVVATAQVHIVSVLPPAQGGSPPGASLTGISNAYGISLSNLPRSFYSKITGLLFFYALLGFVSWVAPRSQLIAAPWAAIAFLQPTADFVTPGNQYAFFWVVPLSVGIADGWPRFAHWLGADPMRQNPRPSAGRSRWRGLDRPVPVILVALIAVNLIASPLDPLIQRDPELGPGYDVGYMVGGEYADALAVAQLLPADAEVLASTDVFPLVANDPNAYVLAGSVSPAAFSHLPFGSADPPPAVLLTQYRQDDVPTWLSALLYNESFYHLCAVGWDSPVGAVLLFEGPGLPRCRPGETTYFGPVPVSNQSFLPSQLTPGVAGAYLQPRGSSNPYAISSVPGVEGNVWHGPYSSLAPGRYEAIVSVLAYPWPTSLAIGPSSAVLELTIAAFGQGPWVRETVNYGVISPGSWGELVLPFNVTTPSVGVEVVGDQVSVSGYVVLYGVSFEAAAA